MKLSRKFMSHIISGLRWASFEKYATFNPSPLSLKQLLEFGSKTGSQELSFNFLRNELPVRMANIMKEINHLPDNLLQMPSVSLVMSWYEQSFKELLHFEENNTSDKSLTDFTDTLTHIRNRHANVVETMAQGIIELKDTYGVDSNTNNRIQYFLDRFYMSRISIRMLINQHTLLFGSQLANPRHIGCIDPSCNVLDVVQDAYENARFLCDQYYLISPEVEIITKNPLEKESTINMVYVPSHLYHMLFELFKNAMRAVVEHSPSDGEVPKLSVMISKGSEDLTIRLSDVGGGVPRSKVDQLFQYMYSTAPQPDRSGDGSAPLAGYGYGLPLSRLYARYFQGDLVLNSVEGYGTDAVIYLKVLSDEANEHLPVYNKTASKVYETDIPIHDWSSPWSPGGGSASRTYTTWARSLS
ncbi:pyruvate dehydrogenase (acetyl-transferring) kinase isozyme 1, mitochondrial-like isoform X1 [Haliotis rufescens]|uniref:pyruvate dehydrogenase (acetyl-transferring) kinase isozyme 1, mitochondrial-like isoform X1 n=1 Tax=Haliotis rufescens TaxID=6454 RepID=UPI001EB00822|nr:pyruvate dehydrogenase (acetyl-transferring) kinase isozyme 1, mitochondrial-like isoform X1 [Haliotis rufescens]